MPDERTHPSSQWASRPWAARLLRALVFLLPFAASVVFVWAVSRVVTAPSGSTGFVLWWVALSAAGSAVLWLVDRAARRLLPLAALLQLSLVFPDQAPSRFRAAIASGRVRQLEERLELAREAANASTPAESARLLLTLVAALSAHDKLTRGHSERVRGYAVMLGSELRLSEAELDQLNWAALLHDIGKLQISAEILNKPGRPTEEEWEQLKRHPLYGEALIEPMRPWLGAWADAVGYHHERWDGAGYPRGIAGDHIPLPGRIVAIADVFDVITSARSYKEAGSTTAARAEIARCAGTQFDPRLVRAFLAVSLGRMRMVMGPLSWLAHVPVLGRLPIGSMAGTVWGAAGVLVTTTASGLAGTGAPNHDAALARPPAIVQQHAAAAPAAAAPVVTAAAGRHATTSSPADAPVRAPLPSDPTTLPPLTQTPAASGSPDPAPAPDSGDATTPKAPPTPDPATTPTLTPEPAAAPEPAAPPAPEPPAATPASTVPPVPNRAPSFAAGAARTVTEDSGHSAISGWATAIDPGDSGQAVTFTVDNDAPSLFSDQPAVSPAGTLSFTPAPDAHGTATVTVRAVDDGGTADGGVNTSPPQTFTITIVSVNDAPRFTAGPDQTVLENSAAHIVLGWATSIAPGPGDESGQSVSFLVTNDNAALFSDPPALSPAGALSFTPASGAHGVANVTVRAIDDGGSADGGIDTSPPQTFTIDVMGPNHAPSFTAGADPSVLEDSGPASIPGWATAISPGPVEESGQTVWFTLNNPAPSLFASAPLISSTGTLSFTPAADANGATTFTVHAVDDGGTANGGIDTSAPQPLTITITPVNDAPSFTRGANQSVVLSAAQQNIAGWATGISPGPADESGQTVSFTVTNTNPALFLVQPRVDPDGTLVYQPGISLVGTATVTVRAVDNGGTANGGVDTSAAKTFTITVVL